MFAWMVEEKQVVLFLVKLEEIFVVNQALGSMKVSLTWEKLEVNSILEISVFPEMLFDEEGFFFDWLLSWACRFLSVQIDSSFYQDE